MAAIPAAFPRPVDFPGAIGLIEHPSMWQPVDAVPDNTHAARLPRRNGVAARMVHSLVRWFRARMRTDVNAFADDGDWHW